MAGFPVLGYTPETRIAGGIYTNFLFEGSPTNHLPRLGLFAGISQNKQYSINLQPDIWWGNNTWHLNGELKLQFWPDKFFGLGNSTGEQNEEYYTSKIKGIKIDLYRYLRSSIYSGILVELEHNHIVEYDTAVNAMLPEGSIYGWDKSMISGIGIGMASDTRDHVLFPTHGSYNQVRLVYFSSLLGSSSDYLKWIIDLRRYISLGNDHLLYLQGYAKFQIGQDIPFRNLSLLGGDNLLRGYFRGMYRDRNIIAAQVEYHSPYFWRIGGVVFAGAGDVFGPDSKNSLSSVKPSAGIGIRFRFLKEEKLNVRLDYGSGKGDRGLYVNILEAF